MQHRALRAGARLGRSIGRGDSAPEYESRASVILDYLQESHDVPRLLTYHLDILTHRHSGTKRRDS